MTAAHALLLVLAGLGAGLFNGVAGGGTLISFPVLLAAGYPALTANVTSTVGIWTGYLGGVAGFRRELQNQKPQIRVLSPSVLLGAVAGGILLLTTPSHYFRQLAPYLLVFACLLFAAQPVLRSWLAGKETTATHKALLHGGMFLASVYGAYFGPGLGVVMLAILGSALAEPLIRINGLRTVLSLMVNTVAVVIFVADAPVAWAAAGVMTICALLGGYVGSRVARRVPTGALRVVIISFGLVTAVRLFMN